MFTGIISHFGKLQKKEKAVFIFTADDLLVKKLDAGTSIAINGICLTVLQKPTANIFSVEIMPETEKKTNMQYLQINDLVNLELPATPQTFLSGHIVQGHIDQISEILEIKPDDNSYIFTFSLPLSLNKYMVEKGSITINGISLTIISINKNSFTVGIIPHTWKNTMLHTAKKGNFVNIEVDVLAKYVEKAQNYAKQDAKQRRKD
jgi:riboflavin synthase